MADLVKDQQYVYGRKKGDTEDSLYLVDVTPYIYWSTHTLRRTLVALREQLQSERDYFKDEAFDPIIKETGELIERVDRDLAG